MLKNKDDFRAVVAAALGSDESLCMDDETDRNVATGLVCAAIFREMSLYTNPAASEPFIEDKAIDLLKELNPELAGSPMFDVMFDVVLSLIGECQRLRKAEHEMRQIACYTMRKRLEHEEGCPAYDDTAEETDENDA